MGTTGYQNLEAIQQKIKVGVLHHRLSHTCNQQLCTTACDFMHRHVEDCMSLLLEALVCSEELFPCLVVPQC